MVNFVRFFGVRALVLAGEERDKKSSHLLDSHAFSIFAIGSGAK